MPLSDKRPPSILRNPSTRPTLQVQTGLQSSNHPTFVESTKPSRPSNTLRNNSHKASRAEARGSTFTEMGSSTWAPRPPPEDVYERLEEFFPEHDLDKPVIDASSGGTSPTTAEPQAVLAPPVPVSERSRVRATKKSIRIVAEEHKKRIDRTSRADPTPYSTVLRKRSTKLWGSRLEEVPTPAQAKNSNSSLPESPSGGPSKSCSYF